MPPSERTNPFYRPIIGAIVGEGAVLWVAPQSLSPSAKLQARNNMGLGTSATMNSSAVATEADADQLVRGDDPRLLAVAGKANRVDGKLAVTELPDQATMLIVEAANQAARLALSVSTVLGKIVKQLDNGTLHILKTGGDPSQVHAWEEINTPVTLGSIGGMETFILTFLGSDNTTAARSAIGVANVSDVPSSIHAQVAGNLRIGSAANYLQIAVSIAGNFTVNAPYTAAAGTYYLALTSQSDGSIPVANITGLSGALALKADLVSGKVPLSQLPELVGNLTVSLPVANQAARLALTPEQARGKIVVQADEKTSWMLVAEGNPSTPTDWLQLGDTEITAGQIVNATSIGLSLLTAADLLAAQAALELDPSRTPTYAGLRVSLGTTEGLAFAVGGVSSWRNVLPPSSMTGSSWVLPNRAGYLAWSSNADGSINGADINGWATKADLVEGKLPGSQLPNHGHGNITFDGRIGTQEGLVLMTSTGGLIVTGIATSANTANTIVRRGSSGEVSITFIQSSSIFAGITGIGATGTTIDQDGIAFTGTFGASTRIQRGSSLPGIVIVTPAEGGTMRLTPIKVSTSRAALIGQDYNNLANATYTDPSGATNGDSYTVFVIAGTATVGGTGFSVPGTRITRSFNGTWSTHHHLPS